MQVPSSLTTAMQEAVADGVFPGAVLAVRLGEQQHLVPVGRLSSDPSSARVTPSTVYDLASLTKPLATVTALALLVQDGLCRLNDQIGSLLPELAGAPVASASLRRLLTHSTGLPGWRGYYEQLSPTGSVPTSPEARADAGRRMLQLIGKESLIYGMGEKSLYSDLGFILLGLGIERVSGLSLDRFVRERICQPLALAAPALLYLPGGDTRPAAQRASFEHIAPTEEDSWRGRLLCGEVHDENAAVLGGVAGHAGLFGTAEAVLAVTGAWLRAHHHRPSILDPTLVRQFTSRQEDVPGSTWALGWDTPSSPSSSGQHLSQQSFGHLGYTGTSIWVDPGCELEVVLLSNRVHPTRKNDKIRAFRPAMHDLVYRECVAGN